jgi:hypothetical protein
MGGTAAPLSAAGEAANPPVDWPRLLLNLDRDAQKTRVKITVKTKETEHLP